MQFLTKFLQKILDCTKTRIPQKLIILLYMRNLLSGNLQVAKLNILQFVFLSVWSIQEPVTNQLLVKNDKTTPNN